MENIEAGKVADAETAVKMIKDKLATYLVATPNSPINDLISRFEWSAAGFSPTLEEVKTVLETSNLSLKHSISEVVGITGEAIGCQSAQILSAGSWGTYTEDAVVLSGTASNLEIITGLAHTFRQSRIAVEDLSARTAYIVETSYCEDPDLEAASAGVETGVHIL